MRGLFINNTKAKDSIYESGYMTYSCLKTSNKFNLDYIEIDIDNRNLKKGYDFYFFNYHPVTMAWLDPSQLRKNLGFCITIVLEVEPNDPFVGCSSSDFDAFCVLDPTLKSKNKKVYSFPRPLEKTNLKLPEPVHEVPIIGTFGFATKGKGFQNVVEAVNNEFDRAVIKLNIPYGDFVSNSKEYAHFLVDVCKKQAKQGIEVHASHEFLSKEDLIMWCSNNTLNCFLYDRQLPGLAATTDQAIISGRPLAVSDNDTFRHITAYLPPYPLFSLKDSIEKSAPIVKKMQQDWSSENFLNKFEFLIEEQTGMLNIKPKLENGIYQLELKSYTRFSILMRRFFTIRRKLIKLSKKLVVNKNDSKRSKTVI